jgi:hypothetical protein
MKIIVVDHRRAYSYVLNASTYTVRELSLAGMSHGFWVGTFQIGIIYFDLACKIASMYVHHGKFHIP